MRTQFWPDLGYFYMGNNSHFSYKVHDLIKAEYPQDNPWKPSWALELEHLANFQVASSYIYGVHGWCDWDGNIHAASYNIGKRPTVEEVLQEWSLIAQEFPFLDLRCQLMSGEYCEYGIVPVVEFVVSQGKAQAVEAKEQLHPVDRPGGKGSTAPLEIVERALELTRQAMRDK